MAEVHQFPAQRREFITDGERSELRGTWHNESGYVVISLWRGETCVATSHLTPREAARLSGFITSGLADLAGADLTRNVAAMIPRIPVGTRLSRRVQAWRETLASSLEKLARNIR
jgi:hypothetical protein